MSVALEQQVATALVADATSTDLAALLTEIDVAIVEAEATAKAEHDKALDPIASPDVATAKQSMEAASFAVARLRALQPRLARRYEQACAQEQLAIWRSEYDELQVRQDALADELSASYPKYVTTLADLFGRIATLDEQISQLHRRRPAGVPLHLPGAERKARDLDAFTTATPSITEKLQLPRWEDSAKMLWPRPWSFDQALFVPLPADRRQYSADWWQVKEEEARAPRDRREREEKEREAKALENYHGPRWWETRRA